MRKLMLKDKLLLMLLVAISVASLSGCNGSLPPAPDVSLYNHVQRGGYALCTSTKTGKSCPPVDVRNTDKWYLLTPSGFEAIMNYIDDLIRIIESKLVQIESNPEFDADVLAGGKLAITAQDLRKTRSHLKMLKKSFRRL